MKNLVRNAFSIIKLLIMFRLLIVEIIAFEMQRIYNLNMATAISLHDALRTTLKTIWLTKLLSKEYITSMQPVKNTWAVRLVQLLASCTDSTLYRFMAASCQFKGPFRLTDHNKSRKKNVRNSLMIANSN